jgi:hypothetical protein
VVGYGNGGEVLAFSPGGRDSQHEGHHPLKVTMWVNSLALQWASRMTDMSWQPEQLSRRPEIFGVTTTASLVLVTCVSSNRCSAPIKHRVR